MWIYLKLSCIQGDYSATIQEKNRKKTIWRKGIGKINNCNSNDDNNDETMINKNEKKMLMIKSKLMKNALLTFWICIWRIQQCISLHGRLSPDQTDGLSPAVMSLKNE